MPLLTLFCANPRSILTCASLTGSMSWLCQSYPNGSQVLSKKVSLKEWFSRPYALRWPVQSLESLSCNGCRHATYASGRFACASRRGQGLKRRWSLQQIATRYSVQLSLGSQVYRSAALYGSFPCLKRSLQLCRPCAGCVPPACRGFCRAAMEPACHDARGESGHHFCLRLCHIIEVGASPPQGLQAATRIRICWRIYLFVTLC